MVLTISCQTVTQTMRFCQAQKTQFGKLTPIMCNCINLTCSKCYVSTYLQIYHLIVFFLRCMLLCGGNYALCCRRGCWLGVWSIKESLCTNRRIIISIFYIIGLISISFGENRREILSQFLAVGQQFFRTSFFWMGMPSFHLFPHCHFGGCLPSSSLRNSKAKRHKRDHFAEIFPTQSLPVEKEDPRDRMRGSGTSCTKDRSTLELFSSNIACRARTLPVIWATSCLNAKLLELHVYEEKV